MFHRRSFASRGGRLDHLRLYLLRSRLCELPRGCHLLMASSCRRCIPFPCSLACQVGFAEESHGRSLDIAMLPCHLVKQPGSVREPSDLLGSVMAYISCLLREWHLGLVRFVHSVEEARPCRRLCRHWEDVGHSLVHSLACLSSFHLKR